MGSSAARGTVIGAAARRQPPPPAPTSPATQPPRPPAATSRPLQVVENELHGNLKYILYDECSEVYVQGPNATRDKGRGTVRLRDAASETVRPLSVGSSTRNGYLMVDGYLDPNKDPKQSDIALWTPDPKKPPKNEFLSSHFARSFQSY